MKLPLYTLLFLAAFSHGANEDDGDLLLDKKALPIISERWKGTHVEEQIKTYSFLPAALDFMRGSKITSVFEGMPHQFQERELLETELAKNEKLKIAGFFFYPTAQLVRKKDQPSLLELLQHQVGFNVYRGPKFCGGFHPDFTIRFTSGEEHCDLLLCFGCGDARILHNGKIIYCHIPTKVWKELLAPYSKLRPKLEKHVEE